MHTDEYEISIGREINHCRKTIRSLEKEISAFEKRYGIDTETILRQSPEPQSSPVNDKDFSNWQKAWRGLQYWKNMLDEYQKALAGLKME